MTEPITTVPNTRWGKLIHRPGANSFRLLPGSLALALMLKYSALMIYSGLSIVILVPSFVSVGGRAFAFGWAVVIFVCATIALIATIRTWFTSRFRFEKWSIAILVLMFLIYSIVIVVRGILQNNWDAAAVMWLPIALSVLPTIRYYSLSARVK